MLDKRPGDGQRGRALVGLAWCHFQMADYTAADKALAAALQLQLQDPLEFEARLLRGQTLEKTGDLASAWEMLSLVVRDGRRSPYWREGLWQAARLAERMAQPEAAIGLYEQLIDAAEPESHTAGGLYNLAWLLRGQGQLERAGNLFGRLYQNHRESPYWAHAAFALAQRHLDDGHADDAEAVIADLLASDGNQEILDRALYLGGQIAFAAEDWQRSLGRFERLLAECPSSRLADAAEFAAAEAMYRGHDPAALERFERIATAGDATIRATARLRVAQLHAEADRWDDAWRQVDSFAADFPEFPEQHEVDYVIGRCLAARARFAEAREAYRRVIESPSGERTETAAKAQLMIAETYFHQKDYEEAFRSYMRVEVFYDYPELRAAAVLQAGKCRQLAGKPSDAVRLYQQVVNDYPRTHAAEQAALNLKKNH